MRHTCLAKQIYYAQYFYNKSTPGSPSAGLAQPSKRFVCMPTPHKNKTFTTFLAAVFGSLGVHRFYLYGRKDLFGWLHLLTVPVSLLAIELFKNVHPLFAGMLFILSILCGFLEALVIGLTPDDKWDEKHNTASGKKSESHWILALLLVLTVGIGAMSLIALLARSFDLLFTGGAYG